MSEIKLAIILTLAMLAGFSLAWWFKLPKTIVIEKVRIEGYDCPQCKYVVKDKAERVYVDGVEQKERGRK